MNKEYSKEIEELYEKYAHCVSYTGDHRSPACYGTTLEDYELLKSHLEKMDKLMP